MSQIANLKLSRATALGGLSVNLNHLKNGKAAKGLMLKYMWIVDTLVHPGIHLYPTSLVTANYKLVTQSYPRSLLGSMHEMLSLF